MDLKHVLLGTDLYDRRPPRPQVLGKGSFGKVMLVRRRARGGAPAGALAKAAAGGGELYALKTLRKGALLRRKQLVHTAAERSDDGRMTVV